MNYKLAPYLQNDDAPILLAQAHGAAADTTHTGAETGQSGGGEHGQEGGHESPLVFFGFSMIAFIAITLFLIAGTRKLALIPDRLQNIVEMLVETLYGIPEMVMGERGRPYAPFLSTFFLYILVMNFMSLVPFFKPGTANLSITMGMAIVSFFAVQYFGFKTHGIRYLSHFLGPVPAMAFLILPLELISELARPVSLSMRLYGNIFGEEQVVGALATYLNPVAAVVMLPLQVLTVILQAFVFTLLTTVYIAMATQKHDDHEHAAQPAEAAAH